MEIYYKQHTFFIRNYRESAHMIMEAEKSHDLPSARWRPREASGSKRPEHERSQWWACAEPSLLGIGPLFWL